MAIVVPVNFTGDARGVIEDLDDELRRTNIFQRFGQRASARFRESFGRSTAFLDDLDRRILKSSGDVFDRAGRRAATFFGVSFNKEVEGFSTRFRRGFTGSLTAALQGAVIRDPRVLALFAASIIALFPAMGTLAAGAFVLAFGAGLATLGLVFAAQNEEIKKLFSELGTDLAKEMRRISKPFEDTLRTVAQVARDTFGAFVPALEASFSAMAPALSQFVTDLGAAFRQLIPAIAPLTEAFNAILADIGPKLSVFFKNLSDSIINMSAAISANPDIFGDLFIGVLNVIPKLLNFFAFLTRAQEDLEAFFASLSDTAGAKILGGLIDDIVDSVTNFFGVLKGGGEVGKTFEALKDFVAPLVPIFAETAAAVGDKLFQGLDKIAKTINTKFLPAFRKLLPILAPVAKFFANVIGDAVVNGLDGVFTAIDGFVELVSGIINAFVALVTGDWEGLWESLKDIGEAFIKTIFGAIKAFLNLSILGAFRNLIRILITKAWTGLWRSLVKLSVGGLKAIAKLFARAFAGLVRALGNFATSFVRGLGRLFVNLGRSAVNGLKTLAAFYLAGWQAILKGIPKFAGSVVSLFGRLFSTLGKNIGKGISAVVDLFLSIPGRIGSLVSSLFSKGKEIGGAIFGGIKDFFKSAGGLALGIASQIKDAVVNAVNDVIRKFNAIPLLPDVPLIGGGNRVAQQRSSGFRTTPAPSAPVSTGSAAGATSQVTINQNYFGPQTGTDRLRELDWLLRYGTSAGLNSSGRAAVA